jgi:hypothetical protein
MHSGRGKIESPARNRRRLIAGAIVFLITATLLADEQVRRVQTELRRRHLYFGEINGQASPEVENALKRYQERKGLKPTGALDQETLRSLSIPPTTEPAPQPPAVATATATPPGPPRTTVWPEVTLLKSDQALDVSPEERQRVETGQVDMKLPEPVATAPIASADGKLAEAEPRLAEFVRSYLADCASNELNSEMRYYAPQVDYFDHGMRDHDFIRKDVANYYGKWPKRRYELDGPVRLVSNREPNEATVYFRIRFSYQNDRTKKAVEGRSDNQFTIATDKPELQIVAMKEQLVY